MVYQNYNDIPVLNNAQVYGGTAGLSEAQINKMRAKEEKRRRKEAQKAAKAAEQAARYEAEAKQQKRLKEARDILDRADYKDVRVSLKNLAPACSGPACGPQTYEAKVASANRKMKSEELKARQASMNRPAAMPAGRSLNMGPARSMSAKTRYGYYPQGSRSMPVPTTKNGYVKKDYLVAVQNGRPPRAIAIDARGTSKRVYPARLTPKQAGAWIKNPGCGDIVGIDAPKTAVPTVYRSRNVAPEEPVYLNYRPARPPSKAEIAQHVTMKDSQGRAYLVKTTPNGFVSKTYLQQINDARHPRARIADEHRVAMRVIPASPTPYQAKPWIEAPHQYDIQGIDAPDNTPVTYRRDEVEKIKAKSRPKKKTNGQSASKPKSKSNSKPKAQAKNAPKAKSAPKKTGSKAPAKNAQSKAAPKKAAPKTTKQSTLQVSSNKKGKSSAKKGSKR